VAAVWHTVLFDDVVGVRVHRGLIGNIELIGVRCAAGRVDYRRGLFRGIEVGIGQDDRGAAPREGERRFSSDAASRAGDHQQLAVESLGILGHFESFMVVSVQIPGAIDRGLTGSRVSPRSIARPIIQSCCDQALNGLSAGSGLISGASSSPACSTVRTSSGSSGMISRTDSSYSQTSSPIRRPWSS